MSVNVLLEGPYGGSSLRLQTFKKIVLVVGGSGISLALSYLQEICESKTPPSSFSWDQSTTVHVIWAVKQSSCASNLLRTTRLAHYARSINEFSMDVFVTRGTDMAQLTGANSREGNPILPAGGTGLPIRYHNCRPDIVSTVLDHAHSTAGEKIGVVSCGPPEMADDSRLAVVRALQEGCANVELIEESFGW
jgi:NAD(P)H-flavin reductase